jgi:hypothetical protein
MDELLEAFTFGNDRKVPPVVLTDEQRELFHGFDEIGGDITMYEDAVNWFKSVERKVEALYCCIIILDKPTSWLFGGISNDVKKSITSSLTKIAELSAEAEASTSTDVKTALIAKIMAQVSLNENLDLNADDSQVIVSVAKKSTLSTTLCRSMALFNDVDLESFDESQLNKMKAVRMWWQNNMALVNVSRMKRVALMYLEMCLPARMITPAVKWMKNHDGKPSKMKVFGSNELTKTIMKADVDKFVKNKKYWKDHRGVFNVHFLRDPNADVLADHVTLSQAQTDFRDMCSFPTFPIPDSTGV